MNKATQWVSALKRDSRSAFKNIYEEYADKVFRLALKFYLNEEEAEEIVQEVFLTLWEKRRNLKEDSSINAYLLTIAKNKIINVQKKKAIEIAHAQDIIHNHNSFGPSGEEKLIYSDLKEQADQFIDSLPFRNKEIFLLSRKEGLTNDEIAKYLDISKRTVENNIYQAEKAIKSFFYKKKIIVKSVSIFIAWLQL